jgi:hypothetical protein
MLGNMKGLGGLFNKPASALHLDNNAPKVTGHKKKGKGVEAGEWSTQVDGGRPPQSAGV